MKLLDEKLIFQNGSHKRVLRWFKGAYPEFGVIINGLTGVETVVEVDVIVPNYRFVVS